MVSQYNKYTSYISVNECQTPAAIPNSSMSNTKRKYVYRDVVTITCYSGYTIQGQNQIQCQADETWSSPPTCTSKWVNAVGPDPFMKHFPSYDYHAIQ